MMTPLELRQYEFKSAGRNAYKADDVDAFFGGVIVAYEKMYRENAELVKRMSLLADRLERYKNDEEEIKQAVLSAQKAADIIVREAQNSVEDTKLEAEAILAAAKGEAEIIKSDAEKQAIADSELLLSIARDKAESIIVKAKEEAHGILIEANDSASDTVGAATRTITSESIHYEMLKKEVSDFRASILAQYKAHIELISKLPELADEEADKVLSEVENETEEQSDISKTENIDCVVENVSVEESTESMEDSVQDNETYEIDLEITNDSISFVEDDVISFEDNEIQLEEDTGIISDESDDNDADAISGDADFSETSEIAESEIADIPISKGFSLDSSALASDELKIFFEEDNSTTPSFFDSVSKVESDVEPDADELESEDEEPPKSGFRFFRKRK